MATTPIDNLEIRIQASASNASNRIDSLVASLSGMKNALKGGIGSLTTIAKQLDRLNDSVAKFAVDRLEQIADVLRDLKGIGKVNVGASVTTNEPGQNAPGLGVVDQGGDVAGAAEEVEEAEGKADEATISWKDSLQALSGSLKKVTERAAKFFESFKRIARLMIIRALIRGLISGLKEGIKNLRAWSETTNQVFAKSMDRAAAAAVNFKNAIAVAVAPIINVLVPYLVKATQKVMEFANALANMFAAFSGKSTFDAVIWGAEKTDESLTSAGKAAKKLKDLLGFDEINRLSDKSSGGGGGSSSTAGWEGAFEERKTNLEEAKKLLDEILGIVTLITALKIWKYLPKLKGWLTPLRYLASYISPLGGMLSELPLGAVATAFGVIVSVVLSLKNHWDDWVSIVKTTWAELGLSDKFKSISDSLKNIYDKALKPLIDLISSIVGVVTGVVGGVVDIIGSSIIGGVIPLLIGAINGIVTVFEWVFEGISKIIDGIILLFKGGPDSLVEGLLKICGGLLEILCSPFAGLWEFVKGIIQTIKTEWEKMGKFLKDTYNKYIVDPLNKVIDVLNKIFGLNINHLKHLVDRYTSDGGGGSTGKTTYQEYAAGGFPQIGQTFIARESGPELVGTIGGRTAVATNNDIVAAVSQGVASAVASVMGGSGSQNIAVNVDGRNLFNIMVNQNNAYVRQTGTSPLLV